MRRTSSILLTLAVAASVLAATPASVATETPMIEKRVYADGTERWVPATGPQLRSLGDPGRVVAVSEDIVVQAHGVPNDPFYGEQWNFTQIDLADAWDTADGSGIVVAVLDSGLSPGPDLACRTIVHPFDAFTFGTNVEDATGHGTHVAGTVGQCTDNGFGVAGVAPGVTIMPVRVLNGAGSGTGSSVANGIAWAVDKGADVITMSLGSSCDGELWPSCGVDAIDMEIDEAIEAGIIVVASTGNDAESVVSYPAAHPDVIAVGATSSAGSVASYSTGGPNLTVVAPGGDTVDRDSSGTADLVFQERENPPGSSSAIVGMFGTSMAAPHVAGTIALLLDAHPGWSPLRLRCVLIDTAADLGTPGFDTSSGWGEIRPAAAVTRTGEAYLDVGDEWFRAAIDHVTKTEVALGYDDCTFRPNDPVTRAEAVTMLVRAYGLTPLAKPTGIFPDVPAGSVFAPFVEAAALAGWVTGYPDGSFAPDAQITRAEVAVTAARVWAPGFAATGGISFADVTPADWFHDGVIAAAELGIVNGYPDGSFAPRSDMTRAEISQLLLNAG